MTTIDTRPSIAELKMKCARDMFTDEGDIILAAPVLLEIAASGLSWRKAMREHDLKLQDKACTDLLAALDKVTP